VRELGKIAGRAAGDIASRPPDVHSARDEPVPGRKRWNGKNEEAIRSLPLLAGLEAETIDFMVERMQEVTVPIRGHIVKRGNFTYRLFVILEGSATVSQGGRAVANLEAGDVFGEMALIDDILRNADVVAVTPLRLLALMSWDFREALTRFPSSREDHVGGGQPVLTTP
jgi:Cyclic nucleotide-binding domain